MSKPSTSLRKPPSAASLRRAKSRSKPATKKLRPKKANVVDRCIQWKNGQYVRRLSIYLPPELALKMKSRCAGLDAKLSQGMVQAVCHWLGEDPRDYDH